MGLAMEESRRTGLLGEVLAARHLRDRGWRVTSANYRAGGGEVDIIAEKDGLCVFFEVKSRTGDALFAPATAVNYGKEERVKSAAAAFISAKKINFPTRFDIIEVVFSGEEQKVNHIENAF